VTGYHQAGELLTNAKKGKPLRIACVSVRVWGTTSQGRFYRQKGGRIEQAAGSRTAEWHPPEKSFTTDDAPAIIDGDLWGAASPATPPTRSAT
jgi:hypothetical protein